MGKYHGWISLIKKKEGEMMSQVYGVEVIHLNYPEKFSKLGHGNYARHVERE